MPESYEYDNLSKADALEQKKIYEDDGATVDLTQNDDGTFRLIATYPDAVPMSPAPSPSPVGNVAGPISALSWESASHPERTDWSAFVFSTILARLNVFDTANDADQIRSGYSGYSDAQRATIWSQFICGITKYESSWNPLARMEETTLGIDVVTGLPVWSEGLLQLSYQDQENYPSLNLGLDWVKDSNLGAKDPKKTILNPHINLEAGIKILANQIQNKGSAILQSDVYWATIKKGGKYDKSAEIIAMVASIPL